MIVQHITDATGNAALRDTIDIAQQTAEYFRPLCVERTSSVQQITQGLAFSYAVEWPHATVAIYNSQGIPLTTSVCLLEAGDISSSFELLSRTAEQLSEMTKGSELREPTQSPFIYSFVLKTIALAERDAAMMAGEVVFYIWNSIRQNHLRHG